MQHGLRLSTGSEKQGDTGVVRRLEAAQTSLDFLATECQANR
jgi:hypothetical protein